MRAGLPSRSSASARLTRSSVSLASLSLPLAFFSSASTRRSRLSRSASISSVSMVSISAIGSMRFSTWVTSSSSKQRTTCAMASTSRILARNWLPSPSPLRRAAHQAGDVHEGQPRRHDLDRLGELRQLIEARIGHRDLADIRLDGAERIVRRLRRRRFGERVEERRLADIRQADDAAFEAHYVSRGFSFGAFDPAGVSFGSFGSLSSKKPLAA